jgi:hypothetical protein
MTLNYARGWNPQAQAQAYAKYRQTLQKEVSDSAIVDIPARLEDLEEHVWPPVHRKARFSTVRNLYAHVQGQLSMTDFCALAGVRRTFFCSQASTVIGRSTFTNVVDIDLGALGFPQVARRHAILALYSDLNFYLIVKARYAIVNGERFTDGQIVRLKDLDVVDIGQYVFLFVEHADLMAELRGPGLGAVAAASPVGEHSESPEADDENGGTDGGEMRLASESGRATDGGESGSGGPSDGDDANDQSEMDEAERDRFGGEEEEEVNPVQRSKKKPRAKKKPGVGRGKSLMISEASARFK